MPPVMSQSDGNDLCKTLYKEYMMIAESSKAIAQPDINMDDKYAAMKQIYDATDRLVVTAIQIFADTKQMEATMNRSESRTMPTIPSARSELYDDNVYNNVVHTMGKLILHRNQKIAQPDVKSFDKDVASKEIYGAMERMFRAMMKVQRTMNQPYANNTPMPHTSTNPDALGLPVHSSVQQQQPDQTNAIQSTLSQPTTEVSGHQHISPIPASCPSDMPSDAGDVKHAIPVRRSNGMWRQKHQGIPPKDKSPSRSGIMRLSSIME